VGAAAGLLLAGLAALAGVGRSAVARRRDAADPDGGAPDGTPGGSGGRATAYHPAENAQRVPVLGAAPVRTAPPGQPPALANPSPTLQALTGAMLNGPAAVPVGPPAGTPVDGRQPAVPVQAVAWYDQAFAPDEMAAVFEGQIEEPAAAADKPGQPRIMGRAVVIYREEP